MMVALAGRERLETSKILLSLDDGFIYCDKDGSDFVESRSNDDLTPDVKRTGSQDKPSHALKPVSLNMSQLELEQHQTTTPENSASRQSSETSEVQNKSPTSVLRKRSLVSRKGELSHADQIATHGDSETTQLEDSVQNNECRTLTMSSNPTVSCSKEMQRRQSKRVSFHVTTKPADFRAKCSNIDGIDLFAPGTTSHLNSARRRMQQIERLRQQRRQFFIPVFVLLFVVVLEFIIFLTKSPQHVIMRQNSTNRKSSQMSTNELPSQRHIKF